MYALDLQDFRGLKATIKAYLGYHIQPRGTTSGAAMQQKHCCIMLTMRASLLRRTWRGSMSTK